MDSRKSQTATVTPAEPGDYLVYLSLPLSRVLAVLIKWETLRTIVKKRCSKPILTGGVIADCRVSHDHFWS